MNNYEIKKQLAKKMSDPMWLEFIEWCHTKGINNDSKAFEAFMSEKKAA